MPKFLCEACGVQHAKNAEPPARCATCEDARQFVPITGQAWTTQDRLAAGHFNGFRAIAPYLLGLWTMPHFAIGQRAFLVKTQAGNVLWDCLSLLDSATIETIKALGGLRAIAISHPHYYSAMADWGRAFDCPVLVHEADRQWVAEPGAQLEFWNGDTREIAPGVTLHRLGGHFPGSAVLHLADHRTLLSGDTVLVAPDRKHVAFMWSYPNYVPLAAAEVIRMGARLAALDFDAIYSSFWERGDIARGAKAAVERSVDRHIHGPSAAMGSSS